MENNKIKKALGTAGDAAALAAVTLDIGATGGAIAGGKLIWGAMSRCRGRRQRRLAEAYIESVAARLGTEDSARLATALENDELNQSWDVIEEGFRALVSSVHEDAKQAIVAMVADYIVHGQGPDRDYQLVGKLLASADRPVLDTILSISAEFSALYDQRIAQHQKASFGLISGLNDRGEPILWGCVLSGAGEEKSLFDRAGFENLENRAFVLRALERFEFGVIPPDVAYAPSLYESERHPQGGACLFGTPKETHARMRKLYKYVGYAIGRG